MRIALIAAMANNRVIGKDNKMPWHLPEDLRHFKQVTMGKPVVMGRRTYESIGRPLPGRQNIVITRRSDYILPGVTVASSFEDAMTKADVCEELMVIGGGQLYAEALPQADVLYLTEIALDVEGDTWFPHWDDGNWIKSSEEVGHSADGLEFHFLKYVKSV
ncbi:dihydrofolate reductase [Shewanella yunxiaonensis]|uniref:Dihydrofolate reductase n=1 Tax=Shewanella yunxiaonensis TaxID=2829809 RepID=A0ABX7YUZ4_9GAMM|nr:MULTISPECIES: dihydrofolate reductase [Shewanella]MDF0533246.1 dihydrofolate reductase [Shewanella sp. A32]QUN06583.1 dihydrofolate reductase [Shewanella yunxiaonensis]